MHNISDLMDHTFRHEYGRLVAMLTRKMGIGQLEEVEDAVQSALLKAMHTWSRQGLPEDPPAWLYRTANNALLDRLRRAKTWKGIHEQLQYQQVTEQPAPVPQTDSLDDDQLRMLFVSCHPAIGVEAQITFALKTLCGFSTAEIAHALLTQEAAILKRLTRTRDKLREEALDPDAITTSDLEQRLQAVQTILYLLFNEGYNSRHPDALIRSDLCEEAVRLTQLLIRHPTTATPETKALFALLLLHAGRLQARLDETGGLVLLDEQDRSTWDWSLIQSGFDWLAAAATGNVMSKYHIEAAIAAEHCKALKFEETNWGMIDRLYELLYRMEPTAIHALNRAIALSYLHSPRTGIVWLSKLHPEGAPPGYHHWPAALGELHRRQGDTVTAREYFEKAIAMSPPAAEREFLEKRLLQCVSS